MDRIENVIDNFNILFNTKEKVQELRDLILDMAVRGKLVPQDPNEEPATVLLEKIETDKKRLIKEGKIKKLKKFSPIKDDEIPYELPKEWEWVRINQIVELDDNSIRRGPFGSAIRKDMFVPKGPETFKVYEQQHAIKKDHNLGYYYITKDKFNKLKRFEIKTGDIIISCAGTIGETYLLPENIERGIINQALLKIRINNIVMTNDYFLYLFKGFGKEKVNEDSKGSAMKNLVSVKYLKEKIVFPLPPLNEQKRIVNKIDDLMLLCDQLEASLEKKEQSKGLVSKSMLKIIQNSKDQKDLIIGFKRLVNNFKEVYTNVDNIQDLKNTILHLAVSGKLVPQKSDDESASELLKKIEVEKKRLIKEKKIRKSKKLPPIKEDEIPYDLPEGWEWVRIGDITHNFGNKKPDKMFCYIDVSSINNQKGTISNEYQILEPKDAPSRARRIVKEGCVIYSTVRPYLLNIAIVKNDFEYEPIVSTAFGVLNPYLNIDNRYLYYFLRSPVFISYVEAQMVGLAYPAINQTKLLNGLVPLPPIKEQKRIVKKVNDLMQLCEELESNIIKRNYNEEFLTNSIINNVI